jgi:hypothetical protein
LSGKPRVPIRAESSTGPALASTRVLRQIPESAFRQAGLACSLDNALELLAERRIVGVLRAGLRQGLDRGTRSHLQELRDRRRRFGFLTSPADLAVAAEEKVGRR